MTISSVRSVDIWAPVCAQRWCRGGAGDDGVDGAALVSGRRRGRRGAGVGREEGKGIAGEGEGERGDRYKVGAAQY